MSDVPRKWRPPVRLVIAAILIAATALPLTGLFFFRVYENQLIHQTEGELIGQSAAIAAIYRLMLEEADTPADAPGKPVPAGGGDDFPYHPVSPVLDLATDHILGRREDGRPADSSASPAYQRIGTRLDAVLGWTQDKTLAGFRVLDPRGVVIAGRDEKGLSLAHVAEVKRALAGVPASAMRMRVSDSPDPPLYSVSRGTKVRVFVAMPVVLGDHIAGVVYASRTPSNIVKHFYQERGKLLLAGIVVVLAVTGLGFVAARTLTRPLIELTGRTRAIAQGDRTAMQPLAHHGTAEMAELSDSFLAMARQLQARSDHVANFASHVTHELKSPLTSIQGAAELLRDGGDDMTGEERRRFLDTIVSGTERLALLTGKLRDLARAETAITGDESTRLDKRIVRALDGHGLVLHIDDPERLGLRISADNLAAMLGNLADNAARHGAARLSIAVKRAGAMAEITIADDGTGISEKNRERVFDPFFTTRRAEGGTGMGLGIVRAMAEAHGGSISLAPSSKGACFLLTLPLGRSA